MGGCYRGWPVLPTLKKIKMIALLFTLFDCMQPKLPPNRIYQLDCDNQLPSFVSSPEIKYSLHFLSGQP